MTSIEMTLLNINAPSVEMTLPRVTNDLLMLLPSFSLCPLVPAASARSLYHVQQQT